MTTYPVPASAARSFHFDLGTEEDTRLDSIDDVLHRIEHELAAVNTRLAGLESLGQYIREIHDELTRG